MDEDDFLYWQDTLEAVQAGRTGNLECPFCHQHTLKVSRPEPGQRLTRVACQNNECRHYIEGRFSAEDVAE